MKTPKKPDRPPAARSEKPPAQGRDLKADTRAARAARLEGKEL